MSQFEYVAVAIALVFTLAVGRVLAGATHATAGTRRYLIHSGWLVHILLACVAQWWILWRASSVEWTAFRFLWILALPTLQFFRAAILLGDAESVTSYRDHFYRVRRPYFAVVAAVAVHSALTPWILGMVPWFVAAPVHPPTAVIAAIAIIGFSSSNERVHALLLCAALGVVIVGFILPPLPTAH